jgi:hypothetical protein
MNETYYKTTDDAFVIIRVQDPRSAEAHSTMHSQAKVDRVFAEIEKLREIDTPMFTEQRLRFFFPELSEIDRSEYSEAYTAIDEFNAKAMLTKQRIEAMSDGELADYIFFFSSNTGLLIPADVDAFMEAVFFGWGININMPGAEADIDDATQREILEYSYAILNKVEKEKDPKYVQDFIKLSGGVVPSEEQG